MYLVWYNSIILFTVIPVCGTLKMSLVPRNPCKLIFPGSSSQLYTHTTRHAPHLVEGTAGGIVVVERALLRRVPVARRIVHRDGKADLHAPRDIVEETGADRKNKS